MEYSSDTNDVKILTTIGSMTVLDFCTANEQVLSNHENLRLHLSNHDKTYNLYTLLRWMAGYANRTNSHFI